MTTRKRKLVMPLGYSLFVRHLTLLREHLKAPHNRFNLINVSKCRDELFGRFRTRSPATHFRRKTCLGYKWL